MSEFKAKIGDKADFLLYSGDRVFGDILYIPNGSGDCWIVQDYWEGKKNAIVYIQNFQVMFLRQNTDTVEPPK